jgi:TonB family protein
MLNPLCSSFGRRTCVRTGRDASLFGKIPMRFLISVALLITVAGCQAPSLQAPVPAVTAAQIQTAPSSSDAPPVVVFQIRPDYPKDLAEKKITGRVVVDFIIETDGTVRNATAIQATNGQFAEAAVVCVKKWKFKPGLKAGLPVRTHMQVPLIFEMDAPQK